MTATDKKSSTNSILVQGSILVVTSFVSRLIGLCYRFPLTRIVGKVGMDYYGTAYSIYSILLVISTYSVPTAISKMILPGGSPEKCWRCPMPCGKL